MEGEGTVFAPALEGMKHVKSEEGEMLSKPFLDVCKQILPVIDNFGAAMTLVKTDVGGNITRLENKYLSNPAEFQNLFSMVRVEVEAKKANGSSSCTNGLLWLTRAMDFIVELFRNLMEHEDWAMSQVCTEAYTKTLKKYHGWLASSTFTMAMKLAPDRKKFMAVVGEKGDIKADIEKFCATFTPLLQDNHKFLASLGLDEMKAKLSSINLSISIAMNKKLNSYIFFYRIKGSRVEYNYRCIEYKPRRRVYSDHILIQNITPLKMGTIKVKGLLKGLRYISQVFDEDKKQNIQIGTPTDVKHVAHIGCDGSAQESPSWMRGFGPPASSDASEAPGDGPQWVSEDSGQRMCRRECHEKLKIKHHRHRSVENAPETDSQTKPRQPRRHHTRGAEGQCARDETLPEVPKRTRKKKPKDESKSKTDDISSQALAESDTEK